jgi:hypothetical protein
MDFSRSEDRTAAAAIIIGGGYLGMNRVAVQENIDTKTLLIFGGMALVGGGLAYIASTFWSAYRSNNTKK